MTEDKKELTPEELKKASGAGRLPVDPVIRPDDDGTDRTRNRDNSGGGIKPARG